MWKRVMLLRTATSYAPPVLCRDRSRQQPVVRRLPGRTHRRQRRGPIGESSHDNRAHRRLRADLHLRGPIHAHVEPGVAGLVLVPDGQIHFAVSPPVVPIGRGTTTTTLNHRMEIPPGTKRLDVLIALEAQDRIAQTSTTLTYQVQ